jgi:hypothetical protein
MLTLNRLNRERRSPALVVSTLSKRNYFEITASLLFFVLGVVIFIRSLWETGLILGMGVGAVFVAYGIFRLRYIWRFFLSRDHKL